MIEVIIGGTVAVLLAATAYMLACTTCSSTPASRSPPCAALEPQDEIDDEQGLDAETLQRITYALGVWRGESRFDRSIGVPWEQAVFGRQPIDDEQGD